MRVLFWVQHLLGTGHLKRAVILAEAMAQEGLRVVLASGGPPAPWLVPEGVELVQLPPVHARDASFAELLDADGRPVDDAFRARRRDELVALFAALEPRVVITEMFPFGRRAFRSELLPLLEAAAAMRPEAWRLCSVRDILVGKPDPGRQLWMRDLALAHYHRVLVHTDPALALFGLTFPHAEALGARLVNTGYVIGAAPPPRSASGAPEVLVSAGGGRVGARLLRAAIVARALCRASRAPWRLIAGGSLEPAAFAGLRADLPDGVLLEHQRDDFPALLGNCLLSVSQAGYNTVLEALSCRKPMVLVPFETAVETEQRTRALRLVELGLAQVVWESDLTPRTLARAIDAALAEPAGSGVRLDLGGAGRTARLVAGLAAGPEPVIGSAG